MPEERVELSRGCPRGILSPTMLRAFRDVSRRQRPFSRGYAKRAGVRRRLGPFSTAGLLHVPEQRLQARGVVPDPPPMLVQGARELTRDAGRTRGAGGELIQERVRHASGPREGAQRTGPRAEG